MVSAEYLQKKIGVKVTRTAVVKSSFFPVFPSGSDLHFSFLRNIVPE